MIIEIAGQQWQVNKVEAHHPGVVVDGTARRGTDGIVPFKAHGR